MIRSSPAERKKEKGPTRRRPFPQFQQSWSRVPPDYPFVTTGGGGVAQPAIVASVSTATIARASFFIPDSPVPWTD